MLFLMIYLHNLFKYIRTQEDQYAEWVAACRLGSRGRSLADPTFVTEASAVRSLLALQRPQPGAALQHQSVPHLDHLQPDNFLAPRFLKKLKGKVSDPSAVA